MGTQSRMEWEVLLNGDRLAGELVINDFVEKEHPHSDFGKDYSRILNSAAFRRLQDKTQVFPLDKGDFVRTRLTHSFETSEVAKSLASMITTNLSSVGKLSENDKVSLTNAPEILACAGLIHDIGNPPFGHFGEEIIKKWFESNLTKYSITSSKDDKLSIADILEDFQEDFKNYDGNAQALRVLTTLHKNESEQGLNLTAPVLNSIIKYPTFSNEIITDKNDINYQTARKKMGIFRAEEETYKNVVEKTGANSFRHPLALILEAADDIAYKTADIEDGLKKDIYSLNDLTEFLDNKLRNCNLPDSARRTYQEKSINYLRELKNNGNNLYAMQTWIANMREWFKFVAVFRFRDSYNEIMNGTYKNDLFHNTYQSDIIDILGEFMNKYIYPNREIVKLELSANTILTSLLDKFVPAVLYYDEKYKSDDYVEVASYKKLHILLSENYVETYNSELTRYTDSARTEEEKRKYDIYLRLLLVVDYMSGMTDSYAKNLYQALSGL